MGRVWGCKWVSFWEGSIMIIWRMQWLSNCFLLKLVATSFNQCSNLQQMDHSRYFSAVLKAPIGAFVVLFIYLLFDILTTNIINSPVERLQTLIGSSLLMLAGIYVFYTVGLVLIIPIIWGLHHFGKLNIVTSMILGGIFGCLGSAILSGTFTIWPYLGPLMGVASGYLLWASWPKDSITVP